MLKFYSKLFFTSSPHLQTRGGDTYYVCRWQISHNVSHNEFIWYKKPCWWALWANNAPFWMLNVLPIRGHPFMKSRKSISHVTNIHAKHWPLLLVWRHKWVAPWLQIPSHSCFLFIYLRNQTSRDIILFGTSECPDPRLICLNQYDLSLPISLTWLGEPVKLV